MNLNNQIFEDAKYLYSCLKHSPYEESIVFMGEDIFDCASRNELHDQLISLLAINTVFKHMSSGEKSQLDSYFKNNSNFLSECDPKIYAILSKLKIVVEKFSDPLALNIDSDDYFLCRYKEITKSCFSSMSRDNTLRLSTLPKDALTLVSGMCRLEPNELVNLAERAKLVTSLSQKLKTLIATIKEQHYKLASSQILDLEDKIDDSILAGDRNSAACFTVSLDMMRKNVVDIARMATDLDARAYNLLVKEVREGLGNEQICTLFNIPALPPLKGKTLTIFLNHPLDDYGAYFQNNTLISYEMRSRIYRCNTLYSFEIINENPVSGKTCTVVDLYAFKLVTTGKIGFIIPKDNKFYFQSVRNQFFESGSAYPVEFTPFPFENKKALLALHTQLQHQE